LAAAAHHNIGLMQHRMGQLDLALESYRTAIRINEKVLGPEHRGTANARVSEAEVLRIRQRRSEALAICQRAVATLENDRETPPGDLAAALQTLAETLLALGQPARALPAAERAARLRDGPDSAPADTAAAKLTLSRALWESTGDRARAVALASGAQQLLAGAGPAYEEERRSVAAWITRHPRP
jgi:tetratricopeptide (TPR) repeat protein